MVNKDKLFTVRWRSYKSDDYSLHRFLLFAPNVDSAVAIASQLLADKGSVYCIEEFGSKERTTSAATGH